MDYRSRVAYALMLGFVFLTSVGVAGMLGPWAGITVAGLTSGLVGYLLGAE
jgi:hypothetical protein